jgi:hypothetical protein
MTLFLIHLYASILIIHLINFICSRLTIKLPMLLTHFTESKIIQSLLNTLNLSSDMILHILKYLLQNPIETHQSVTNFAEID